MPSAEGPGRRPAFSTLDTIRAVVDIVIEKGRETRAISRIFYGILVWTVTVVVTEVIIEVNHYIEG